MSFKRLLIFPLPILQGFTCFGVLLSVHWDCKYLISEIHSPYFIVLPLSIASGMFPNIIQKLYNGFSVGLRDKYYKDKYYNLVVREMKPI